MTPLILALSLLAAEPYTLRGSLGVWLSLQEARDANECLEKAPLIEQKLKLLSDDSTLATREILELRASLGTAMEQNALVQAALEKAVARGESVWRAPVLWFTIGVVVSLVGALAVAR